MKKEIVVLFLALSLLVIPLIVVAQITTDPNLVAQVLKTDPSPVNVGDWFDLWVKVQNTGQNDAQNARFELQPAYPFSSNDTLIRDYGTIYGTLNAYKVDQTYDSTQVILKFRVKVSDNAPEGVSSINLKITPNINNPQQAGTIASLPIEIGKTKSNFDVTLQDITAQGTSFIITNTGDNKASSVVLSIVSQDSVVFTDANAVTLGDLNQGDFTIAHIGAVPKNNTSSITLQIAYTDNSGNRITTEKVVTITNPGKLDQICQNIPDTNTKIIYTIVGILIGILLAIILKVIKRKK